MIEHIRDVISLQVGQTQISAVFQTDKHALLLLFVRSFGVWWVFFPNRTYFKKLS